MEKAVLRIIEFKGSTTCELTEKYSFWQIFSLLVVNFVVPHHQPKHNLETGQHLLVFSFILSFQNLTNQTKVCRQLRNSFNLQVSFKELTKKHFLQLSLIILFFFLISTFTLLSHSVYLPFPPALQEIILNFNSSI